jgi:hypothetical protein
MMFDALAAKGFGGSFGAAAAVVRKDADRKRWVMNQQRKTDGGK